MSSQPVEANVVLTADNSGYDQAMMQSSQSTNALGKSIDGLGDKINKLTKSAGKKLLGITAADVALITGATAAWASYEKQMSKLSAQAAIVGRGREAEQKTMKSYTESVKNMRKEFGSTTQEAAQLTQTIAKMADQTRSVKSLGTVFTEMSHATGESSSGLASSLLNLQKVMGTPQAETRAYSDQLTTLAAKSNTSATALADFSSQIAPMGRAMGMSQKQVIGFANMFTKAGQDGVASATAFSKVSQDITQAVQTGSPELNKYARLLGVTTKQFTQMDAAEQVGGFFDQIAKMGPRASQELNRFGLDGVRMSKAIIQTVQASGGAMNALREGNAAYGSGSTAEGAKAAETMSTVLAKLRQQLQMTAESFGKAFGPGIMLVMKGIEAVASKFEDLMDGPLGKFIQVVSAIIIPVTAAAGVFLLMAKAVTAVSLAFTVLKSSPMVGLMSGLKGFQRISPEVAEGKETGRFVAGLGPGGRAGVLSKPGADIAERGSWAMRGGYNALQPVGAGIRKGFGWLGGVGTGPDELGAASRENIWARGAKGGISFAGRTARQNFDAMLYQPGDRDIQFRQNFMDKGPPTAGELARGQQLKPMIPTSVGQFREMVKEPKKPDVDVKAAAGAADSAKKAAKAADDNIKTTNKSTAAIAANVAVTQHATAQTGKEVTVKGALVKESGKFAGTLARAEVELAKFGATAAAQGAKKAGAGLVGALGGPWGAAITGGLMLATMIPVIKDMFMKEKHEYEYKKLATPGSPYLETAGVQIPGAPEVVPGMERAKPTMAQARQIGATKVAIAKSSAHHVSDKSMKGLNEKQVTAYLGSTFSRYKDDPEAMDQLTLDLVDKFDEPTANRIVRNLYQGDDLGGSGTLIAAAQNATGIQKERLLNVALTMGRTEESKAYSKGSAEGLFRSKARHTTKLFRQAAGGDEEMLNALNKEYQTNFSARQFRPVQEQKALEMQKMGGYVGQPGTAQAGGVQTGAAFPAAPPPSGPGKKGKPLPDFEKMSVAEQLEYQMSEFGTKKQQRAVKAQYGIDADSTGKQLAKDINQRMTGELRPATSATEALRKQMEGLGGFSKMLATDKKAQDAIGHYGANIEDNLKTVDRMFSRARKTGQSMTDIMGDMQQTRSLVGDESKPEAIVATWAQQVAQQQEQLKMPTMSRGEAFQSQVNTFQAAVKAKPTTDTQRQEQQAATATMAGGISDQVNYFRQMLIMQDNYDKQRARAQEDFNLQRQYAEFDYNLQRERSEEAFQRQRKRAVEDFHRNEARAYFNFHLQRKRAEEDFHHSIEVMAKQQAMSMMDIYNRVQTERTSSAEWLLSNAGDQLKRMQEQAQNLDKLRKAGMTDTAIQQLKFNDPSKAQELARFVTEMTPALISGFNKTAGKERVKAAKALVTDESSAEWKEMRRGFRRQMSQGAEDFERQMKQGRQDFKRGLKVQKDEFEISLSQQADDYHRGMDRQLTAYHTMQKRAAKDLADTAKELNLSLEEVLTEGGKRLTGATRIQVKAVSAAFTDLKTSTSPAAVEVMQQLADIFGFEYTVPKGISGMHKEKHAADNTTIVPTNKPHSPKPGAAEGGVMPGYTPGQDIYNINVSGGEAIMRPEWTRAVGQKKIDKMNHDARHGKYAAPPPGIMHEDGTGFAGGGVFRPINGSTSGRIHDSYTGFPAVDISAPVGTPVFAVYDGRISRSEDIRGYEPRSRHGGLGYRSYGRVMQLKTDRGIEVLYAHLSKRGVSTGAHVSGGQAIAASGNTGHSYGPHLHFGSNDGNPMGWLTGHPGHGAISGVGAAGDAGSGTPMDVMSVLKERYHKAELAAKAMDGVHPLWRGDISQVINRFAKKKIKALIEKYGTPMSGGGGGMDLGSAPSGNLHNEQIVHTAANRAGWGGQWGALRQLVMHESGFRNTAQNPSSTAYGMFQFLDSTWAGAGGHKTSDPWLQTKYGLQYIKNRYNNPNTAWNYWQNHHSYKDGSVFNGRRTIDVGEAGPEAVIPLNERGANFMTDVMSHAMGGRNVSAGGRSISVYNTHVDRSTNFTGPITVQANNPHELLHKLQARQRVMALSRPALTGSAA